jgi:hypothetical protein
MAIWQAYCELEIVPSLHSNLAGATSATGAGLAGGGLVGATAGWGVGPCATNFWKSAQPAHEIIMSKARAERTRVASGDISCRRQDGFRLSQSAGLRSLQHITAAHDSDTCRDGGEGLAISQTKLAGRSGLPADHACGKRRARRGIQCPPAIGDD